MGDAGLLMGAQFDYPEVTRMNLKSLFTAMDRRGTGAISVADLAACHPREWQAHGWDEASAEEKLRALPWAALGGANEAFSEGLAELKAPGASLEDALPWPEFESLVSERTLGFSEDEAYLLFCKLADKKRKAVLRDIWSKATAPPEGANFEVFAK